MPTAAPTVAATPVATLALAPAITQPATTVNGVATDRYGATPVVTSSCHFATYAMHHAA